MIIRLTPRGVKVRVGLRLAFHLPMLVLIVLFAPNPVSAAIGYLFGMGLVMTVLWWWGRR